MTAVAAMPPSPPARVRARLLALWVAVQVAAASLALLAVALTTPIDPGIALLSTGRPDVAITAGLTFWLAFGLVGGLRTRLQPGGGVVTFSMPFIVAGTVLGGPLVGGLMGLVSEFEVRELQTKPWYGILSNHAVGILAGVGSGVVAFALRARLDELLPGQTQLIFFAVVLTAALAYTTTNVALVIPSLAIKNDLTLGEASRSPDATFRATSIAEAILAWNLAASYALIGWWAPIAIVALVLAVWQAFDRGEALRHDPMTRLLNDLGLRPHLEKAIDAARHGRRCAAYLLLDLDQFKAINDAYLLPAGDEVIVAIAGRLLSAVRATDAVARLHRAGDEFAILFDGVTDLVVARRLAERVQGRISEGIHLRTRDALVSVGVSIGGVLLEPGVELDAAGIFALADARMMEAKRLGSGIVFEGFDDQAALELRLAAGPRREEPARP